jgi:hypothetical protein
MATVLGLRHTLLLGSPSPSLCGPCLVQGVCAFQRAYSQLLLVGFCSDLLEVRGGLGVLPRIPKPLSQLKLNRTFFATCGLTLSFLQTCKRCVCVSAFVALLNSHNRFSNGCVPGLFKCAWQ